MTFPAQKFCRRTGPANVNVVLGRLRGVHKANSGWIARCPAHDDRSPSLSVGTGSDGRILLHCFAGCSLEKILASLGLTYGELFGENISRKNVIYFSLPRIKSTTSKSDHTWTEQAERFRRNLSPDALSNIAHSLGVSEESLRAIDIGVATASDISKAGNRRAEAAYTFPEYDAQRCCIGLALRFGDGSKGFLTGGKRGLVVPRSLDTLSDPVLCVEGPSDVAACLTLGHAAVGRPSCSGGAHYLSKLLRTRKVLIVGENDRKSNGLWPGRDGAKSVATHLSCEWKRQVRWTCPPDGIKDMRAWLATLKEAQ